MKVLVIEDSSFQRKHIVRILTDAGYEVVQASNGAEGLEMLASEKPEIVCTDLLMPDMDGVEFLLKKKESGNTVPAFVLSSDIQKTTQDKCRDLGAVNFLNKPVDAAELLNQVREISQRLAG